MGKGGSRVRRKLLFYLMVPCLFLAVTAVPSQASVVPISTFNESGVGDFNEIDVFATGASVVIVDPVLTDFDDGSWFGFNQSSTWYVATGNTVTSLDFSVTLAMNGLADLYAVDRVGSTVTVVDAAAAVFTVTGGWTGDVDFLSTSEFYTDATTYAPEPASAVLLVAGLMVILWLRRRGQQSS